MQERMKVAFISGKYRSETVAGIVANIRAAEKVAAAYWLKGYAVICPHKNTALFDGLAPDSVWLEGDLELLRRADAIVMVPGWENSSGAKAELAEAVRLGLEVIMEGSDANQI